MLPQVKQDPDSSTPYIKPDPDNKDAVLADIEDEDLYEDAGDLDFTNAGQSLWLSRIPRSLWEHWSNLDDLDDDEEIQVGTVRIEGDSKDIKRVGIWLAQFLAGSKVAKRLRSAGQFAPERPRGESRHP